MIRAVDEIVLGIDGGGTNTRAVLVSRDGALLGVGRGGPSNYHAVGRSVAQSSIDEAVKSAWDDAGLERGVCSSAFLGMAGVIGLHDAAVLHTIATELQLAQVIGVDHDIRTALAGGLGADEGIALIAGTGSSCYGRRNGRSHRAGGWGKLFDDAGGAYRLALDALDATARAIDGRGDSTALVELILAAFKVSDPDELPAALLEATHSTLAGLAPVVLQAAEDGDSVATAVAHSNADELALMVETVARTLGWLDSTENARPQVVAVGGTVSAPFYRALVTERIAARIGYDPVIAPLMPPALGAALLALDEVDDAARERLASNANDKRLL